MASLPPSQTPLSTSKPLAEASRRLLAQSTTRRPSKVSPDVVIGMSAAGVPQVKIAQALGVSDTSIENALNRTPDSRERIAQLREKLKLTKIEHANRLEERMWQRLAREVDEGTAKDVDALSRALFNSEKIQAAASGEAHASGAAPALTQPAVDLKILLQQLVQSS